MFRTDHVLMVLAKATMKLVKDDKGVEHRMAECALVLDPLVVELALEMGEDVAGHLFDVHGAIRTELDTITLDPRTPQQAVTARMAPDAPASAVLRNVDILSLTVAKQVDDKSGHVWLKATVRIRFGLAERAHREFLAARFGDGMLWSFQLEQRPLDLGTVAERAATNPGAEFVDNIRKTMGAEEGAEPGSVELTMVKNGRRVGTRITKDKVEKVDRPEAAR